MSRKRSSFRGRRFVHATPGDNDAGESGIIASLFLQVLLGQRRIVLKIDPASGVITAFRFSDEDDGKFRIIN
jgi:hypothetical protein